MGQQNLFHQLLLGSITTTAVAEVVFRTGTHTFLQVTLLQSFHKGGTHHSRQIAVLTVGLFQTVEAGGTTHINHRRQRQHTTHLTHSGTRLSGLQLCQFGIERTGLSDLLRIDGGTSGVHT